MCLRTVTWVSKNPTKNPKVPTKWTKGYKVFTAFEQTWDYEKGGYIDKPILLFPYNGISSMDNTTNLELNKAYKAEKPAYKDELQASDYGTYPWGFHIFPVKMAGFRFNNSNRYKLFLVEYRRVVAEGTHTIHTSYEADCVIAREMRIIRQLTDEEVKDLEKTRDEVEDKREKSILRGRA
jgi:hypothetical protein